MSSDQLALLKAAEKDNAQTAQSVLEKCGNLDTSIQLGETALWLFASMNNSEMVAMLIEKKANPSTQDSDGKMALHWAAVHGNEAMCQKLLDANVDPDQATIEEGLTALHMSCLHEHPGVCLILLKGKADADIVTNYRRSTALHIAARNGSREQCEMLMSNGDKWQEDWCPADGGKKDRSGKTAMEVANGTEVVLFLMSKREEQHVCWVILLAIKVSLYLSYACQIHKFDSDNRYIQ